MSDDGGDDASALDALLLGWDEDRLAPDELATLRGLLADAGHRARLVEHFRDTLTIEEALRAAATPPATSAPANGGPGARRLVHAAIAATLAVAVAGWLAARSRGDGGGLAIVVAAPAGGVVAPLAGPSRALEPGSVLRAQDTLIAADGPVTIRYGTAARPEATTLALSGGAALRLDDEDGAKRVRLDRGAVACEVAKQPPGKAMVLATPQARAEVVGTRFTLACDATSTRLAVAEGIVRFSASRGEGVDVPAGRSAQAGVDAAPRVWPSDVDHSAAILYRPGFAWRRSRDARDGDALGARDGNPGLDAAGNPAWRYESIHGGDGIGGADPWYARSGEALRWDDWYGAPKWVRGREVGPVVYGGALIHVLAFPRDAPAVRWLNPTGRDARLTIRGALRVRWEKAVADRVDPGPVDVVVARIAADGSVGGVLVAKRLAPSAAAAGAPIGTGAVRLDEQAIAVDLADVACARGEQIVVTARGTGGGGWVWIGDELTWSLADR